jgi:hypothetical protein
VSSKLQNDKPTAASELSEVAAVYALLRDLQTTLDQQTEEFHRLTIKVDQLKGEVARLAQRVVEADHPTVELGSSREPLGVVTKQNAAPVDGLLTTPTSGQKIAASLAGTETLCQQVAIALSVVCLVFSLWAVTVGWHRTIFDNHGFRQAQTAITTYYFKYGNFLNYETPVLGPPWSIPFEFPLYQALVAATAKILPLHLDQAGRLISVLFFYATFVPFFVILRSRGASKIGAMVTLALFAISPFYLFWSRTFMIESTALFLAVSYLALVTTVTRADQVSALDRWGPLIGIAFLGSLAGLTKVTTFAAFWLAAIALILLKLWKDWQAGHFKISRAARLLVSAILVPVVFSYGWTAHADSLKSQNPMGFFLTSNVLQKWNFGTFDQRLNPQSYTNFAFMGIGHVIDNLTGSRFIILLALALLIGLGRRSLVMFLVCLGLYVSAIAIFFNLHMIHSYYAYANAIFLIAAIGFCFNAAWESGVVRRWAAVGVFALAIGVSIAQYFREYYEMQNTNAPGRPFAAAVIDRETSPASALLVYGLDWSSEFPYQAHRRALTAWKAPGEIALQHAIVNLGIPNIGALVVCDKDRSLSPALVANMRSAGFAARRQLTADNCDIFLP